MKNLRFVALIFKALFRSPADVKTDQQMVLLVTIPLMGKTGISQNVSQTPLDAPLDTPRFNKF